MPEHAEGTTEVVASPAEVMAVIADFEAYPDWVGSMEDARVLARDKRGRGTRVAFRLRTPVLTAAYTLAYRYAARDAGVSWTYVEEHQPDYLYFGHVHQPRRSRLRVGRTWLVNVGYFRGTGRMLEHPA